jgi:multidrug transporter EmrE-like cation transporter
VVCVVTGLIFLADISALKSIGFQSSWLPYAMALGVLFIFTFNLMARCTHEFGITIASVASKTSMVLPVFASLMIWKLNVQEFSTLNYIGITLAFMAIVFTSVRKDSGQSISHPGLFILLLPLGVFLFSGIIDLIINYANWKLIPVADTKLFPLCSFLSAATVGLLLVLFRKKRLKKKEIIAGVLLGIPNYFSIYFLLLALTDFNNNGAVLYPVFNVSIILLSAMVGILLFKDKLLKMNYFGLLLAILSIILISSGGFI